MIRIRNLLTYWAHEKEPNFANTNAGRNHSPIFMKETVTTMDVKRNSRSKVLLTLGKLVHRIVGRFQPSCPNRSHENSDDIDFTVTPL